jgi:small-conductance mechanosensitive channel
VRLQLAHAAALLLTLLSVVAHAAPDAAATTQPQANVAPAATLHIGGRNVVTLHATVLNYPPEARAEGAKQRMLAAYAKNPRLVLTTRSMAEGTQILADDSPMLLVANGDVNALAGETPELTAKQAVEVLQLVIAERAERSDPRALAEGIGLAVVASLVAFLLMRVVFGVDGRVGRWAARGVAQRVSQVKVANVSLLDESFYLRLARRAVRALAWVFAGIIAFLWLNAVLESLPYTRPWGDQLTQVLLDTLGTIANGILNALPGLMFVAVIIVLARLATSSTDAIFERVHRADLRIGWLDRDTCRPMRHIARAIIWIFALAMAYPYLPGAESRALQGLSVLVGLMVSIGASSTVGQAASGMILMFARAFRAGDYIRIQEHEGTVIELGIIATRIRTGLGEEVMLPNNLVLSNVSKNYSRAFPGTGFIVDTTVTIGYDAPWRQVHAMLIEAARRTEGVVADPPPRVFQTALSDFYAEYRIAAYSIADKALVRAQTIDRLHANIQDVFNEHGVQIMSPHYLSDPESPKVVPKAKWFEPPAAREKD